MAYVPACDIQRSKALDYLREYMEKRLTCEYCKGKFESMHERTCKRCGAEREEYRRA